ncbi:MAG TPA: type II toxin-antitoxin system antitoxin SocA domain-containing protein [Phycisphaerae bacterium]|nr:type II toxin-antitoxin system antitoxin SocA domain-containing protein [Phycisphaerae bacterium]
MVTVLDVATYILRKQGQMTTWKLQKLCYYAQAWSLVWDEKPLFTAHIEAWANGPVIPRLYSAHRGRFKVVPDDIGGNPDALTAVHRETVDAVLKHYGGKSSRWLSQLTHKERPWREARAGLEPGERGHAEITHEAMAEYYDSL